MLYKIWVEGYSATGESGSAYLANSIEADSFSEACAKNALYHKWKYYDPVNLTYWGRRLFDNEEDARKNYG